MLFNILTVIGNKRGKESEIIPLKLYFSGGFNSWKKENNTLLLLVVIMFFPQNASPSVMQNCDKRAHGKD